MSDSWFANAVALDGVKEDGCHSQEAQALKQLLRGQISIESAAEQITNKIENSHEPGDLLPNLWGLLHDALIEIPDSQAKIVALLQAIRNRPDVNPSSSQKTGSLRNPSTQHWHDLTGFGHAWSDNAWWYYQNQWRQQPERFGGYESQAQFVRIAGAEANFLVGGIDDTSYVGYERLCDTLEDHNASLDIEIPAVREWLVVAGSQLYKGAAMGLHHTTLESGRDFQEGVEAGSIHNSQRGCRGLWQGNGGVHMERWAFWIERLTVLQADQHMTQKVRQAAGEALRAEASVK